LRSLAAARLAALVARETDGLVWQSALAALEHDPNGPAIELAYVGLGHAEAEVRRHACLNLAAHPDPRHVPVLAAALDDPSSPVVFAAVQALAAIGRLDDPAPLRRLIATPNELLRVEVAAALCRIGDPSGVEALRRLAYSLDPAIRRRAAIRMGELADPRFVPILVELLDDRLSVRQAALESLPQASRQSIAQPDDLSPVDINEQVRRWKRWYEQSRWKQ